MRMVFRKRQENESQTKTPPFKKEVEEGIPIYHNISICKRHQIFDT